MILVGIDDTDRLDTRGTNQLAKQLARELPPTLKCLRILRHQLYLHEEIPYTSKNSSASLVLESDDGRNSTEIIGELFHFFQSQMIKSFVEGSDPGLCICSLDRIQHDIAAREMVIAFGMKCKTDIVTQCDAKQIAGELEIPLAGLGGTNDGMIGALAAVGLSLANNDGRIVQWKDWPDDLEWEEQIETIRQREIIVIEASSSQTVLQGLVDVGKHCRPNWRNGRAVLFVSRCATSDSIHQDYWKAEKIP